MVEQSTYLPTNQRRPQPADSRSTWIAKRLEVMLSAFRKDEYANPESFALQAAMNLQGYSREVIEYVTAPTTGLQTRLKFPPSLAEIVEACEAEQKWQDHIKQVAALPPPLPRQRQATPGTQGDGGPGTIYSNFDEALKNHGRPCGVFERERKLNYGA